MNPLSSCWRRTGAKDRLKTLLRSKPPGPQHLHIRYADNADMFRQKIRQAFEDRVDHRLVADRDDHNHVAAAGDIRVTLPSIVITKAGQGRHDSVTRDARGFEKPAGAFIRHPFNDELDPFFLMHGTAFLLADKGGQGDVDWNADCHVKGKRYAERKRQID